MKKGGKNVKQGYKTEKSVEFIAEKIIENALNLKASDVHIEPAKILRWFVSEFTVRFGISKNYQKITPKNSPSILNLLAGWILAKKCSRKVYPFLSTETAEFVLRFLQLFWEKKPHRFSPLKVASAISKKLACSAIIWEEFVKRFVSRTALFLHLAKAKTTLILRCSKKLFPAKKTSSCWKSHRKIHRRN